ncbi:hypothetical protein UO65_3126 [Actinokineospora spheciospongiae]|uniref:Uncharacterized protein n=1 Tax=Actinokineospora spheciospongiae TaxID=909613 RepID=W7IL47_9PSEU|nr:hypothetical protein UO65_3126 [Actinokineospora spheciospongiae]
MVHRHVENHAVGSHHNRPRLASAVRSHLGSPNESPELTPGQGRARSYGKSTR